MGLSLFPHELSVVIVSIFSKSLPLLRRESDALAELLTPVHILRLK